MNQNGNKTENLLRIICGVLVLLCSILLGLTTVGLAVKGFRHHEFRDPTFCGTSIFLAVFAFFPSFIAVRLLRGKLSADGVCLLPTWFLQVSGLLGLLGIAYVASYGFYWVLLPGVIIIFWLLTLPRAIDEMRRQKGPD